MYLTLSSAAPTDKNPNSDTAIPKNPVLRSNTDVNIAVAKGLIPISEHRAARNKRLAGTASERVGILIIFVTGACVFCSFGMI